MRSIKIEPQPRETRDDIDDELKNLHTGQVATPPGLVCFCRDHVVRIHWNMDERVHETWNGPVSQM